MTHTFDQPAGTLTLQITSRGGQVSWVGIPTIYVGTDADPVRLAHFRQWVGLLMAAHPEVLFVDWQQPSGNWAAGAYDLPAEVVH